MIRIATFLLALSAATPVAHGTVKPYARQTDAERRATFAAAHQAPTLADRIEQISAPFVGTVYAFSPLGEGRGYDADPRLRWDKVDCLTFVETTLAAAEATDFDHVLPVLDDIRYGPSPPAFNHRNHFVESEWVPHNLAKGYIHSIAREIAGDAVQVASKEFSPELWKQDHRPDGLALAPSDIPAGSFGLEIVPLEFARSNSQRIPNGTLLMVVRKDSPHTSTRVSHVGFVLEKDGKRFLRHASKEPYARVVDEPLDKFFLRNSRYATRPVDGFALFQIDTPTDRIAALTAAAP